MTDHLTDEQLDALEQIIDMAIERRTSWDHVTVFTSMKKVIAELRSEREAHQATREAGSDLVWSIEDCFERGLLTLGELTEQEIRGRIRHWKDATRAGQEASE